MPRRRVIKALTKTQKRKKEHLEICLDTESVGSASGTGLNRYRFVHNALPELDEPMPEDRGDTLPPHGDPIADSAVAPEATSRDDSLLDFEMPASAEPALWLAIGTMASQDIAISCVALQE